MPTSGGLPLANLWTIGISAAAFTLSALSLGWQVVRARYEKPVVEVEAKWRADQHMDLDELWNEWAILVTVSNIGERAVTVSAIQFTTLAGSSSITVEPDLRSGVKLPQRLEPYDVVECRLSIVRTLHQLDPGWLGQPIVTIVGRPTIRQRRRGATSRRMLFGPKVPVKDNR